MRPLCARSVGPCWPANARSTTCRSVAPVPANSSSVRQLPAYTKSAPGGHPGAGMYGSESNSIRDAVRHSSGRRHRRASCTADSTRRSLAQIRQSAAPPAGAGGLCRYFALGASLLRTRRCDDVPSNFPASAHLHHATARRACCLDS